MMQLFTSKTPFYPLSHLMFIYSWTFFGLMVCFIHALDYFSRLWKRVSLLLQRELGIPSRAIYVVINLKEKQPSYLTNHVLHALRGTHYELFTLVFTLLGTSILSYQQSHEFQLYPKCILFLPLYSKGYAFSQWLALMIHLYFVSRSVAVIRHCHMVEPIVALINVALFVQDVIAIYTRQRLMLCQYLILYNYFCPEVAKLLTMIDKFEACVFKKLMVFTFKTICWILLLSGMCRDVLLCFIISGHIADIQ